MLRPFVNISIQQATPYAIDGSTKKREELLTLDFVSTYECESGWENHTDKAEVTLPKNVILQSGDALFKQAGTYNVILGSESQVLDDQNKILTAPPLLMRGDIIYIQDGYLYFNEANKQIQEGTTRFSGFISKVYSEIPIKIECEDNFYLLKRTPVGKSLWKGDLIELCKYMIQQVNANFSGNASYNGKNGNPYPVLDVSDKVSSADVEFSLGHLDIGDITCAELLSKLRTQYKLDSFFVGNTLFFGIRTYDDRKTETPFFEFENNISNENLEYKNKSDVILSAVVSAKTINKTGKKTKDGAESTKWEKDSVLVYWDIVSETFKGIAKKKGEPLPKNEGGERHEFVYPIDPEKGSPSAQTLIDYGIEHLKKYYYTGFRGSFTTIGFPFVKWGDNINLRSKVMADRNGQYKVKKVIVRGGYDGIEQEIHLDYKVNVPEPDFREVYML